MGWDGQTTGLSSIHKFTYMLETDEEDGMGWSDNRSLINPQGHVPAGDRRRGWDGIVRQQVSDQSTCSRTLWRQTKRMGWSDNRSVINPQVHVLSGDRRRRRDGMVRQQVSDQSTSSHTGWRQTKRTGWDGQTTGL